MRRNATSKSAAGTAVGDAAGSTANDSVAVGSGHRRARRPRHRHRPGFLVVMCAAILAIVVLAAVFGDLITPYQPDAQDLVTGLTGLSWTHLFGTDDLGRDIFSRVIAGSRAALIGPLIVALGSAVIGGILGLIAGAFGGWVDSIIMRWADLMYAMPGLLVLIVVGGVLGGGYLIAVPLLVLFVAPYIARIIRAVTMEQQGRAYMEAARTLGVSRMRRIFVHLAPNAMPELVATASVQYATALVSLSSLSFLGLGASAGAADWGLMASENRALIFDNAMSMLAPAGMIVLTAASVTIVGDWLFEKMQARGQAS